MILFKKLKPINPVLEDEFLAEIQSTKAAWFTAKNNEDGSLEFVLNKPNGQFYMARLTKFTNLLAKVTEFYPGLNPTNSYVTNVFLDIIWFPIKMPIEKLHLLYHWAITKAN